MRNDSVVVFRWRWVLVGLLTTSLLILGWHGFLWILGVLSRMTHDVR